MHHKGIFALAGVFLAVALIAPPIILYFEGINELDIYRRYPNPGLQTGGNQSFYTQIQQSRQEAYISVAVVDAVFAVLFVVTMYYGINHLPHTGGKVKPSRFDQEP
jgi:hypothetical protein